MKTRDSKRKRKANHVKPEIKSYNVKALSECWNFEVFGKCEDWGGSSSLCCSIGG